MPLLLALMVALGLPVARPGLTTLVILAAAGSGRAAGPLPRSPADRPDDQSGPQIHAIYVQPVHRTPRVAGSSPTHPPT
jgi:uncharacterized protein involved in high-affinity Fe2+ transport